MKKTAFVMSFLLVFSLFRFISATKASANNKILVGVFYYPWYFGGNQTGHWNGNPQDYGINLSTTWWTVVDEPLLGWYASDNRTVIDQHLAWFAYAGIDFGIISWWGPYVNKTVFDDKWVEVLLNETSNYESAHGSDFKWVVSIEGGSPNESQLLRNWVFVNYTEPYHQIWLNDSENNNKPFLFWMDSDITNNSTTRQSILEDSNFSVRILGQADYSNWTTWTPYTYNGATVAFPPKEGFMCVLPRYDETRLDPTGYSGTVRDKCADPYLNGTDGNNTDPLNGVPLYDKQWEEVLSNASAGKVQYVGIATWNDFTERTQIEPCYDNTSAYKDNSTFLLDKTKYYINLLKDIEALTITNVPQVPYGNVTEYQNVTVYANVSDNRSGVNRVLLNWTTNVTVNWSSVLMTPNSDGFYEGVISGQKAGTSVNYSITAYDNANNWRVDDNKTYYYSYVVVQEFSPLLVLPLFMLAILAVVVVHRRKSACAAERNNQEE